MGGSLESIVKSPRVQLVGISEEGAAAAIGKRDAAAAGVPFMDALRWLAGSEPATVNAKVGNMVNEGLGNEDFGVATYQFENGVVGTLSAGWANPDHSPTWLDVKFEILTTQGVFLLPLLG